MPVRLLPGTDLCDHGYAASEPQRQEDGSHEPVVVSSRASLALAARATAAAARRCPVDVSARAGGTVLGELRIDQSRVTSLEPPCVVRNSAIHAGGRRSQDQRRRAHLTGVTAARRQAGQERMVERVRETGGARATETRAAGRVVAASRGLRTASLLDTSPALGAGDREICKPQANKFRFLGRPRRMHHCIRIS